MITGKRAYYEKYMALLIICVAVTASAPYYPSAALADGGDGAQIITQYDLTTIIRQTEQSVVGVIGKLSRVSKEYGDTSDNIVLGSGIVYRRNGYIITSGHVVESCEKLYVILSGEKVYEAKVVGFDELSDLALLKIEKGMLKPVTFSDSGLAQVGAPVMTIGTHVEFGLRNSVGYGIISGVRRSNTGFSQYRFIQTDAVANPGSSGGPLIDMDGRVLGVVAGGYSSYQGITFCTPSDTIQYVIEQLEKHGRVIRPDLGADFLQSLAADYGLPAGRGLYFCDIQRGGPCDKAGIADGDILVELNGTAVNTYAQYAEEMKGLCPGETVQLGVLSGGETRTVDIVLQEKTAALAT